LEVRSIIERIRYRGKITTHDITITASLASVFVESSFFPLTPFIGGAAFISLEIVMVPVIAALLRPVLGTIAVLVGSLGMALTQFSLFQVFGLSGSLIPVLGVGLGSVAFHYRSGPLLPWTYTTLGAVYYLIFSEGGTLLWLIPYAIVILSLPLTFKSTGPIRIGLLALYATMSELVTLNLLSIGLLKLVGPAWLVITPFMFSERALATIGGAGIIVALRSRLGPEVQLRE
jgi:hypothetical protein